MSSTCGLEMFLDIHVAVHGDPSVRDGQALSHEVKDRLIGEIAGIQVVVVLIERSAEKRRARGWSIRLPFWPPGDALEGFQQSWCASI